MEREFQNVYHEVVQFHFFFLNQLNESGFFFLLNFENFIEFCLVCWKKMRKKHKTWIWGLNFYLSESEM